MSRIIRTLAVLVAVAVAGCKCCGPMGVTAGRPPCASCGDGPLPPRLAAAPAVPGPGNGSTVPMVPAPSMRPVTPPPPPPKPVDVAEAPKEMVPVPDSPGDVVEGTTKDLSDPGKRESLTPAKPAPKDPVVVVPGKEPPLAEGDSPTPLDIPGFAVVRGKIATGLRPMPDGIDWLRKAGYKTMLHVRAPGETLKNDKELIEKKGLKYLRLEASAATLTKELYENFVRLVEDSGAQPVFVYDKDGSVAGGLWYLYARLRLRMGDEAARNEARRLGLMVDDTDGDHKLMLLAVQKVLEAAK